MTYTKRINALKDSASKELACLIHTYGRENKSKTDESTWSVFIETDSPQFREIDRVYNGMDYPLELVLDTRQHANEVDFIVYPNTGATYEYYLACTDDFCAIVDYLKQKYNDK